MASIVSRWRSSALHPPSTIICAAPHAKPIEIRLVDVRLPLELVDYLKKCRAQARFIPGDADTAHARESSPADALSVPPDIIQLRQALLEVQRVEKILRAPGLILRQKQGQVDVVE